MAFAFSASEIMLELDASEMIVFADGRSQQLLGCSNASLVGRRISDLFVPSDELAIDTAILLLAHRLRLEPVVLRLANASCQQVIIGGVALPTEARPRLCITISRPPSGCTILPQQALTHPPACLSSGSDGN